MNTLQASPTPTDITPFIPLVRRLARQLIAKLPANVELDDLVQVGLIGLNDAMARFDAAQGVQFETFATWRIQGAMVDELRRNDWASRYDRDQQRDISAAVHRLEQRLGRTPAESEVAHELSLPLVAYQNRLAKLDRARLLYLEDLNGQTDDAGDFLDRYATTESADPPALLADQRQRQALVDAIQRLPEREQLVMSLIYEQDMTGKDIATVLGVTPSRVSQLHSGAIALLRDQLRKGEPDHRRRVPQVGPRAATSASPTTYTGA
ncbi:MAG: FliA/WhiG family RNA polymerase sigma factor [Leptothrix sp. (in: b-proteobacteria)]